MAYEWEEFIDYLDGTRGIRIEERDELWDALAFLLAECGGRWQLKAADMDAIRPRQLITDLTSIEDTEEIEDPILADLAKVLIEIEDTFTGTTGYDAFKAVRAAEGLDSDEKLAELITETGRLSGADDYHLWNLYKRVLTALTCCPTTEPAAEDDSVVASKTKQGLPEFGTPSTPPIRYLTEVNTTTSRQIGYPLTIYTVNAFGDLFRDTYLSYDASRTVTVTRVVDPDTGTISSSEVDTGPNTGTAGYQHQGDCETEDWTLLETYTYGPAKEGHTCEGSFTTVTGPGTTDYAVPDIDSFSSNSGTLSKEETCENGYGYGDVFPIGKYMISGSCVRSIPHTTDQLKTNTMAALPAFDGDWNDTPGSYYFLSTDELTFDFRASRRRWSLAGVSGLTVGHTYRLKYLIRFQPLPTGSPTDGAETYLEFTFTEGMTHTPYITIPAATANGINMAIWTGWECPSA